MLRNLVIKELSLRYKRSFLGFIWSFLNPMLMMLVYSLLFSTVMKIDIENFQIFLLTNLLPWTFFQTSLSSASTSIVNNANLVKKVYFPREILPLSVVTSNFINFLLSLVVLLVGYIIFRVPLGIALIYLPLVLAVEYLFTAGLSLFLAAMTTYFRDIEHIVNVLLFAWFYVTPVLYPLSKVPEQYRMWFELNPMSPIIDAYTQVMYDGIFPHWESFIIISCVSVVVCVAGMAVFGAVKKGFAEEI
ncbi:ABC transporter permease [Alicyclobacillus macrosporangiidus]|uniref:ABC transporter permease n=1 Tax=Alicyclobacillus macrosporangiidus TaxID=392015 RepID=UPI000B193B2E